MFSLEKKAPREDRFLNPSFSSTLLDKIYRSIDEGERKSGEMKFYRETMMTTTTTTVKKQNRTNGKCNRDIVVEEEQGKQHDKKVGTEPCFPTTHHGDRDRDRDHDQDVLFFSSTSISSTDSSSGGFSSSDTESVYGVRSRAPRASCFAPPKPKQPKPVKTNVKQGTRMFDGLCHSSKTEDIAVHDEKALFKSKLRSLKIYNNLKSLKQPISPGGRLTSFLNSLIATVNAKKKNRSSSSCYEDVNVERKAKSVQASTCSSASSFSRSCLSKTCSSEREKMFNGVKRTVRFFEEGKSLMNMPVKLERSPIKKKEEEIKLPVVEKSRVVEEAAREFLEEYRLKKKNDLALKDLPLSVNYNEHQEEEEDDDDDAASYASSDLFELDHLAVFGSSRYCEELPVYETTHVSTNRAIANGLIM